MHRLPLLSRVAFICNLFFLLSMLLQWKPVALPQTVTATILVAGLFLAPFVVNPLVNVFYFLMLLRRKGLAPVVPLWLIRTNFIFLLLQLVFALFFLHDPFYR